MTSWQSRRSCAGGPWKRFCTTRLYSWADSASGFRLSIQYLQGSYRSARSLCWKHVLGSRRSARLKAMTNLGSASELPPLAEGVEVQVRHHDPGGSRRLVRLLPLFWCWCSLCNNQHREDPGDPNWLARSISLFWYWRSLCNNQRRDNPGGETWKWQGNLCITWCYLVFMLTCPQSGVSESQIGLKTTMRSQVCLFLWVCDGAYFSTSTSTYYDTGYPIHGINHFIVRPSSENRKDLALTLPGTMVKFLWVSKASYSIEPNGNLLQDCSDLFGTLKHYYSFLASLFRLIILLFRRVSLLLFALYSLFSLISAAPSLVMFSYSSLLLIPCASYYVCVPNAMIFSVYSSICKWEKKNPRYPQFGNWSLIRPLYK